MGTTRLVILAAVGLVISACTNSSPSPTTTLSMPEATSPPTTVVVQRLMDSVEPPALVVSIGDSAVAVSGFDYCWTPTEAETGFCADSFGSETPTPITVDTPTVALEWMADGALSAWYRAGETSCNARLQLEATGPGEWSLAMPPDAGTYRINLHGDAPQGSTQFSVLASSSVAGLPALPIAEVWWPDTDDEFALSAELHGIDPHSEATIEVVSADAISTVLPMQLYAPEYQCWVEGGSTVIDGIGTLGAAPYEATLLVLSDTDQYKLTWEWPGDVGQDNNVTGTLHPASSP